MARVNHTTNRKSSTSYPVPLKRITSAHCSTRSKGRRRWAKQRPDRIESNVRGEEHRRSYLIHLCRALVRYGAPTHRIEEYLVCSADRLEIIAQFLYLPGCMIISFGGVEVQILGESQGLDLGRMYDVHNVYKKVVTDTIAVDEGMQCLEQIISRKPRFSVWARIPMYGIGSACVTPLAFGGRWIDMPIAFLLGCILGTMQLVLAPKNELYSHLFEVIAATVTTFLARVFGSLRGGRLFCFSALAQGSIALILPGFMVLCAMLELQTHKMVAGASRMLFAMVYTLVLGYSIGVGATLYSLIDPKAITETECRGSLPKHYGFVFAPCFTIVLCIINQARWGQVPVMMIISLSGFTARFYAGRFFRMRAGIMSHGSNMIGALTIGILANLYSRNARSIRRSFLWLAGWLVWHTKILFGKSTSRVSRRGSESGQIGAGGQEENEEHADKEQRDIDYPLAAAAMLPAIFLQVPSDLASNGSLLDGIQKAAALAKIIQGIPEEMDLGDDILDGKSEVAFGIMVSIIQVAISITVGLGLGALIVYPLGKRKSALTSF